MAKICYIVLYSKAEIIPHNDDDDGIKIVMKKH